MNRRHKNKNESCSIPDCIGVARVRGLCNACYQWCRKLEIMGAWARKAYMERLRYRTQRMVSRYGLSERKILTFRRPA